MSERAAGECARVRAGVVLLGAPKLRTAHVVGQALAMGPVASAFLVAFLIAAHAGPAAPLVVLLAAAGALALGSTIGVYARRFAGTGVVYEYLARRFGRLPGVFAAGAYALSGLPSLATTFLALGLLVQAFAVNHLDLDPGYWACGAVAGLIGAVLQHRGVKLSVRAQLTVTALSAVPLLVLAVAVVARGGASGHAPSLLVPQAGELDGTLRALLFGLGLFGGFETAAALGEEARDPHVTIPRGMLLTIGLAGAFYFLVVYAAVVGFGPERVAAEWGTDPLALIGLGDRYVGRPLSLLLELALIVDFLAVLVAFGNAYSRTIFALARDGLLPRALARRSRHETPTGGILVCLASGLALLALSAPLENKFDVFEVVFKAHGLVLLPILIVLAVGAFGLVPPGRQRPLRRVVVAVGAAVPALAFYRNVVPLPHGIELLGVALAAAMLVACAVWALYLTRRRPDAVASAANYALEAERDGGGEPARPSRWRRRSL